jgi:hypothetical protein
MLPPTSYNAWNDVDGIVLLGALMLVAGIVTPLIYPWHARLLKRGGKRFPFLFPRASRMTDGENAAINAWISKAFIVAGSLLLCAAAARVAFAIFQAS